VNSPYIFLDDATMASGHQFKSLSSEDGQTLQRKFNEVMSG
jgi:hypothetical protein